MPQVNKLRISVNPLPAGALAAPLDKVSALDRIRPMTVDTMMHLLLYGQSGSGKTTLWSSFPGPILAMLCSGGLAPGELKSIRPADRPKIKEIVLQTSQDVSDICAWASSQPVCPYGMVVLDHVSGFQDMVLKEVLGLDEVPVQKSWGMAKQEQYGACAMQCKEHLRKLLSLRCHVVIVAQQKEFKSEGNSELTAPFVGAAVIPSLVGWLNQACDHICHTFIRPKVEQIRTKVGNQEIVTNQPVKDEYEYCLRTGPSDVYITKFRMPGPSKPGVIVNPTYDKLAKILG